MLVIQTRLDFAQDVFTGSADRFPFVTIITYFIDAPTINPCPNNSSGSGNSASNDSYLYAPIQPLSNLDASGSGLRRSYPSSRFAHS
jgi:hypothetical protein